MTDRVIVGYDGRDPSHDALALGAALANGGRPLLAAFVCEEDHRSTATDIRLARERYAVRETLHSEVLARLPQTNGAVRAETLVVPAPSPAEGLHSLAKDRGCAALVVGSTHRGPVGRVLPGSTSGRLLNAGRSAVAVAPRGLALRDTEINTIGVGFDGSPASAAAVRAATELARGLGARLVAMTAGESPAPHLGSLTLPSGDEIELVKLEGRAADALARAAADVDLLVLGSRFVRPALGSVSRELAHECPAPLLIAPEAAYSRPPGRPA